MKKISNFIVEKRNFIIPIFIILAIICVFTSQKVKINKHQDFLMKIVINISYSLIPL